MSWTEKKTVFRMINFHVSRKTSIARQLSRGSAAVEKKKKAMADGTETPPVRETDLSPKAAEYRYDTYESSIETCISVLQDSVDFVEIDAEGTFDDVRRRVRSSLPDPHPEKTKDPCEKSPD
jgi:adenylate kinase family enzyme